MRYTPVVARILLGLAWLLLLVSMFLPQVGIMFYGYNEILLDGWEVAGLALLVAPLNLLALITGRAIPAGQFISIPLFLSDLLFFASLFALLKFKSGRLAGRSIYVTLNLICVVLLALPLPQAVSHLDPNISDKIQLLSGLFVWFGAQVALTLSASVQLLEAYLIERRQAA